MKRADLAARNASPEARARARAHMHRLNADPVFAAARDARIMVARRRRLYTPEQAAAVRRIVKSKQCNAAMAREILGIKL